MIFALSFRSLPRFRKGVIEALGPYKSKGGNLKHEVGKIFIILLLCRSDRFRIDLILFTQKGFKFLTLIESKTDQFEIVAINQETFDNLNIWQNF